MVVALATLLMSFWMATRFPMYSITSWEMPRDTGLLLERDGGLVKARVARSFDWTLAMHERRGCTA